MYTYADRGFDVLTIRHQNELWNIIREFVICKLDSGFDRVASSAFPRTGSDITVSSILEIRL